MMGFREGDGAMGYGIKRLWALVAMLVFATGAAAQSDTLDKIKSRGSKKTKLQRRRASRHMLLRMQTSRRIRKIGRGVARRGENTQRTKASNRLRWCRGH